MKTEDVTNTLELALTASGCEARVVHKPRLLSDNGPSYVSGELAKWLDEQCSWRAQSSSDPGQDRALASNLEEPHLLENYYLPGDLEACIGSFVDYYNHRRYHENLKNSRRPMSTSGTGKPS